MDSFGGFELALFDLAAAFEDFEEEFDEPAAGIPVDFFDGFLEGANGNRRGQHPGDGFDSFWGMGFMGPDDPYCLGFEGFLFGTMFGRLQRDSVITDREDSFSMGFALFAGDANRDGA